MNRSSVAATSAAALLLALTGCGSTDAASNDDGKISVVTSFYPLEYAAEQVGGEHVSVTNLTPPGAEPHDLELTPKQVLKATRADQLVYLAGFQPSVDDAAGQAEDAAFDVTDAARVDIAADGDAHSHEGESAEEHAEHAEESPAEGDGHDHGAQDPHFWLDPTRYGDVAEAIAERLATEDPENADDYRANAEAFVAKLTELDKDLKTQLASCEQKDLVTGHAAFAYFADRYGFTQVPVSGLTPDHEPSAATMADLIAHIKEANISTVYAETLVPRDLAETIARDAGAKVAVLDPIEGVTDESAGSDYFEIMRSNGKTVAAGQACG